MTLSVRPLTAALGAEIFGADVRDPGQFEAIFGAFVAHGVVAIRDQGITPEEQLAFAERFGPVNVNRFFAAVPGHPRVAMVLKEPDQTAATCLREAGASLRRRQVGNAALATQDALHPMAIRHPLSGRAALYVYRQFTTRIEGWSAEESAALLGTLYDHGARPEFTCRLRHAPGTVVVWDNRATWHKAINDYDGQRRLMHRVTVEGPGLHAAARGEAAEGSAGDSVHFRR